MKNIAIVLAGGNGSRMNSNIPKQYMEIAGKTEKERKRLTRL